MKGVAVMATPFQDVYDFFLSKISDYSFINLTEEELEAVLESYLKKAITRFKKCRQDLNDRDDTLKMFNIDLTDEEKNILSHLMIVEYLTPQLLVAELLRQTLNTREFRLYSQANHIKEVKELRDKINEECEQMMVDYTYSNNGLEELV